MATLWNCTVQKTWECMLYSTYHDAAHQSNLKQRNPQKLHDFTDLSCYNVILPLMDRRASSLALFILLSVLYLRMPRLKCKPILSWDNGLSTDLLSCLLLSIIATWACCFYRKSMSLHIWLLPECFLLPPFWTCLPLLLMLGQIYISLSAAYSVWFFWARRCTDAVMLAGPEWFYSFPLSFSPCPTSPSSSLPFLADL